MSLPIQTLPPGDTFFPAVAEQLLALHEPAVAAGDLSALRVLSPSLPVAAALREALLQAAQRPLLLPRFDTLKNYVANAALDGIPDALPECTRQALLYEALRDKDWFDEAALWGIAAEMGELFDELTEAAVSLPDDEQALLRQIGAAYAPRAAQPLAFEARVVHELWRALAATDAPDAAAVYRLRLAALLQQAKNTKTDQPLLIVLDAAPEEALSTAEHDFLLAWGEIHPLQVFHPTPRHADPHPLSTTLAAAWPAAPAAPLYERAQQLAGQWPHSPLAERLALLPCEGREQEARAAVAQIGTWLQQGLRRIALIAQDRLSARRVRALLEREDVLLADETGWLLSTSRSAATIDALLETVARGAPYRSLLDLCKSPFVFSDIDEKPRKAAVLALETAIRQASCQAGLTRFRQALAEAKFGEDDKSRAGTLLERIEAASVLLRDKPAPLARWLERLHKAIDVLGMHAPLAADAAGQVLLELLETRQQALKSRSANFSFDAWRDWLGREFEAATFHDQRISSPIVLTSLAAVSLRRFDAALLLGGDAQQLAASRPGKFFKPAVRQELGLRTSADHERELRRRLEGLLNSVPRVCVSWQCLHEGEARLLAAEFSLLSTLHQLAWGSTLWQNPPTARREVAVDPATAPVPTAAAAPTAPAARIPQRISVSAYGQLVGCPYRFFARYVLGLGEMDEVSEEMDKREYGEFVHRLLEIFHTRHPQIAALAPETALAALQDCVETVFAPAIRENFLATGWRLRWEKRLDAYLDWQRQREAQGWHWTQAETTVRCQLPLQHGGSLELYGRIDRIDRRADGGDSLLDYKTQRRSAIKKRLPDDIQLASYALMHGTATETAYLALDDETIAALSASDSADALADAAKAQGQRLSALFSDLHQGTPLPAHGVESLCRYCEMSGLCRREYLG